MPITVPAKFRLVDYAMTQALLVNMAELSGAEIEIIAEIVGAFRQLLDQHKITGFNPMMRKDAAMQEEIEVALSPTGWSFLLQPLFSDVKAFRVGDVEQVCEIRKRLKEIVQRCRAP